MNSTDDDPRAARAAEKRAQHDKRNNSDRLYPRITHFPARRGHLSDSQLRLWDTHWPRLGKDAGSDALSPQDIDQWFGRSAPTVLEIGFGTGTSTAAMAHQEPDINVLALEVYKPGLVQLLSRIIREDIPHIRLLRGDAVDIVEDMLPEGFLDGIRVFFPDPWPKARHHKRRLLQPGTFELLACALKPGGILHVATDHADYAEFIKTTGDACDLFRASPDGLSTPSPMSLQRPMTKFESKGLEKGHSINDYVWIRRAP